MTSRQVKLQEDTYFRATRILQDNPDFTQRELAEKPRISVGGLNCCPRALMENFAKARNNFGYTYVLTPTAKAEKAAVTHSFLKRKMDKYVVLRCTARWDNHEAIDENPTP